MAFSAEYYAEKKQKLIQKNQQISNKFIQDALSFARDVADIEKEFNEIILWEKENAKPKEEKPKK